MVRRFVFPLIAALALLAGSGSAADDAPTVTPITPAPSTAVVASPTLPPPVAPPVGPKVYAADSDRRAALIASSIIFGVGAGLTGSTYLLEYARDADKCTAGNQAACSHPAARASLVGYAAIVGIMPSLPRLVVGDVTRGLLFSSLRGISVIVAEFAPWGGDAETKWQGPFLLGFAAPIALGIVDLATTPHREDLEPQVAGLPSLLRALAPVPLTDGYYRTHGALLTMSGVF